MYSATTDDPIKIYKKNNSISNILFRDVSALKLVENTVQDLSVFGCCTLAQSQQNVLTDPNEIWNGCVDIEQIILAILS